MFCVQGGWDTSGSELSEGELEKRRRTLLEQLDAPWWLHFCCPQIVFVHFYKHAFPSTFIWLYWSYHPGRTVWDNTFLCSGMCYSELYMLTWLLIWYRENWSAIRSSFCCFCWLQVFFRCSKCFPLPILFFILKHTCPNAWTRFHHWMHL